MHGAAVFAAENAQPDLYRMIASYLYNFIFIKTKKTGGTAIEATLGDMCGPDDIVTPLGPHDELIRGNGQPVCRNFADVAVEKALKEAVLAGDHKAYLEARKRCEFFAHMTALQIRDRLPPEFWSKAHKLTVERHPYEKAVSAAYFEYRPRKDPPFPEYLEQFLNEGSYASYPYYTIDGQLAVDDILRQETLLEDLRRVGAKLGIPIPGELRHMKTNIRKDTRPAREILTDAQKRLVYSICRNEFELLGYQR